MDSVGIRDLKTHLSRHLRRVQRGARLLVTEHGRAIATLAPVETRGSPDWTRELVAEGRARWGGGKPAGAARPPRLPGSPASDAVLGDRR